MCDNDIMKLSKYLETNNISQSDFARMIGVERATVSQYIHGQIRVPSPEVLTKIVKETKGAVRYEDFT